MDDLRRRWLDQVRHVVLLSGMWACNGREMESVARTLLENLCFLDERDREYEEVREELGRYGQVGVPGPFTALFGTEQRCMAEVASVYAEQFHRLGYLAVDRELGPQEWDELTGQVRDRFDGRDVRRSEVEAAFGAPSIVVDRRVLCYVPAPLPHGASAHPAGWVFFDCFAETRTAYVPGAGHYDHSADEDPLVRDVRLPAEDFESGLVLTLYGKVRRWGPGWWIHHPPADASPVNRAIAAQLRGHRGR
ncbi:hypothetical protein ACQPZZ_25415 [Microbispora sp. CA-135349]|uniref:hypothetical protein n=1 Tax=Microbispora sp. CA-135349 TaxID=3239953 RepID=UPI003D946E5A